MRSACWPLLVCLSLLFSSAGLPAQQPVKPDLADPAKILSSQIPTTGSKTPAAASALPFAPVRKAAARPLAASPATGLPPASPLPVPRSNVPARAPVQPELPMLDELPAAPSGKTAQTGGLPEVHVVYPEAVTLNVPAEIRIRLTSGTAGESSPVRLTVNLPEHLELMNATPQPLESGGDRMVFEVPALTASKPVTVDLEIVARAKKPVTVQTRLEMVRERQIELVVQQPLLELELSGSAEGVLGQPQQMELVVRNTGDGEARDLNIDLQLPAGCVADDRLMKELVHAGSLAPGREARFQVETRLVADGLQRVSATARALGAESSQQELGLNVIRPQLELAASAPEQTWVNSRSWFSFTVTNPTTIEIDEAVVTLRVPTMTIQSISSEAEYDGETQALTWRIGSLAAGAKADFSLIAVAGNSGPHLVTATLESRLTESRELAIDTVAQARANLVASVGQLEMPAPVGVPSGYRATVENRGSEPAEDVRICIQLPSGWVAESSGCCVFENGAVHFVVESLAPGERRELEFLATGSRAGENLLKTVVRHHGSQTASASESQMLLFQPESRRVAETAEPKIFR